MPIIATIMSIMDMTSADINSKTSSQYIKIAIASGKGGTGKTFVSTNLFYTLQQKNMSVTLIDCDAEAPNAKLFFNSIEEEKESVTQKVPVIDESVCTFCSKCQEFCNYNAIFIIPPSKIIYVIEDLCHDCGACTYACNFGAITEKEVELGIISTYVLTTKSKIIEGRTKVGVYSPVSVIKAAIKRASSDDIIIMDAPPGTSCPFIQTATAADYVVLVTEPTPFGLSDLKQSVETLKTMNKTYGVIINRSGLGNDDVYNYLKAENIPLLMEIPYSQQIASAYSKGELLSAYDDVWENIFFELYIKIVLEHGNSRYKW